MKPKKLLVLCMALVFALALGGAALATTVTPILVNPWKAGSADFECASLCDSNSGNYVAGYECKEYAFKLREGQDPEWLGYGLMDGDYVHGDSGNTITISNSTAKTFDWASSQGLVTPEGVVSYPVYAVIVKGGNAANVYLYPEGAYSDTALVAPGGKDISHVTFCFSKVVEQAETCYKDETAWAAGSRYVTKGNWATYVEYSGEEKTVSIFAGQSMLAGTATFSAIDEDKVTITINLANTFVFAQKSPDPANPSANLKVQDYETAPRGNPAPGLFDWKKVVDTGATTATIEVPANNYYGVHLDVKYVVPCP